MQKWFAPLCSMTIKSWCQNHCYSGLDSHPPFMHAKAQHSVIRWLAVQYLPEKWYKFHYFDTALFWSYEGQSHEVNIATQSYFQRSFWWAFKKYGICNHLRENWEPLKKWVHFPWTLRLLEPFQVDFRQKPFLIRFSTFIWPGYHEIILEFGQLYWELERNFQKLPQIFI